MAVGLGKGDVDPDLRVVGVADMVAPYAWTDVNAIVDVILHRSGVDPVAWDLSRVVSYYANLEHMGPAEGDLPTG